MTVQELIDQLKPLPQNSTVYLASDAEGNSFGNIWAVKHLPHSYVDGEKTKGLTLISPEGYIEVIIEYEESE